MTSMDIRPHSRRNKSSSFSDDSSVTTATPNSTPLRYLGIPFSWEQVPGIAKKNNYKKTDSSQNLLPLPPSGNIVHSSPTIKKYNISRSFRKDPFFAAFVECSKDKEFEMGSFRKNSKYSSNESTGFVVSLYSSCKRSCSVSESIVYRRRSDTGYILATDDEDQNDAISKSY